MIRLLLFALMCLMVERVSADAADDQRRAAMRARMDKLRAIEERIDKTRPERRDSPLRWENIRDEEVSEIQIAARGLVPEAIVNISSVVTGCPCEEGPACSDQVWILASRPNVTQGLQLSKIGGHWKVGMIQNWWLKYEDLQKRNSKFTSYRDFSEAADALRDTFPRCSNESSKVMNSPRLKDDKEVAPSSGSSQRTKP